MVKILIIVSPVFHKYFVFEKDDYSEKDVKKLIRESKKFDLYLKKYSKRIIRQIERYCNGKFEEKEIIAWMFLNNPKRKLISISDPLLLKYRKNHDFMTYVLIHELVHRFFTSDKVYSKSKCRWIKPGNKNQEVIVHLVSKKVFLDIFGEEKFKKIEKFMQKITSNETLKILDKKERQWNLNKHDLRHYLKL